MLLSALQPFLFTHFCQDGWEDEPGVRVRNVSAMAQFVPDDREDHRLELETTLYVPASAHLDTPHAFEHGLGFFMALVSLLLHLAIALLRWLFPPDASLASAFRIPAARPRARLSTPLFRLRIS